MIITAFQVTKQKVQPLFLYLLRKGSLVLSGRFFTELDELDHHAQDRYELIIEQMKKVEGVTEELKGRDQMAWVARMNNIAA